MTLLFDDLLDGTFADQRLNKERARNYRKWRFGKRSGKRKLEPSLIERAVERSGTACPECQANTDPNNIPVHPGCHCSVKTVSVSHGISPEDAIALAERHDGDILRTIEGTAIEDIPEAFTIAENSVAIFEEEGFRFADVMEWLFATSENINAKTELYAIIITEPKEQQAQQAENPTELQQAEQSVLATLGVFFVLARVYPHLFGEKGSATFNVSKHLNEISNKKQEELQQQLFLIGPDATPEQVAEVFQQVTEGAVPSPSSENAVEAQPDQTNTSADQGTAPEETAQA